MTASVLVIDDSEDDRRLCQRALKDIGCRLLMAASAQSGLTCLADTRPDLILLDYSLPDMDGLSFIRLLAGRSGTRPPIVMLTGEGSESVAVEVMKSGADDYLVKDTAGQYLRLLPGVIGRVVALNAQREQNQRLMQETARLLRRYQALMKNSADGIHVMDVRGNIVEANDAFCRMLGYTPEEVARLNVADWDAQWSGEDLEARFRDFIGKSAVFETVHRRKDGTLINVELSTSHVEMEGKDLFFALSRDITERKQTAEALRQRTEELHESQRLAHIGDWRWDANTDEYLVSEELCRIFGRKTIPPFAEQRGTMYPSETWQQLNAAAQHAVRTGIGYDLELPALRADGTQIWINTRGEAVRNAKGEITGLRGTLHDITEHKRAEQALREADQRKDVFLAMLAHELRNPLAPIRNAAHVLGLLELAEPRVYWAQRIIEDQVNHLSRMVEDLLDVSRIVRGKITLKREIIELSALFDEVIESARLWADRKGHRLTVRLPGQPVQVEGDPVRLSQVLVNLLDNAIKYTPEGGQIELAARMAGEEIEISVRDNGTGISAELLPRVFDLFQQDERTLDRAQGGLGIGLTLVQRLVEQHGGRIEVFSEGPGFGSTFTLWLPARIISLPAAADTGGINERKTSMRVLVVDDNHDVADSMALVLELEGHEVRTAYHGQAALDLVPVFRPQVVLLDIGLGGMDGFDVATRLRGLPEGQGACVVAMTGYGDDKSRSHALASGCDHFLVKPVAYDVLDALLARIAVGTELIG